MGTYGGGLDSKSGENWCIQTHPRKRGGKKIGGQPAVYRKWFSTANWRLDVGWQQAEGKR